MSNFKGLKLTAGCFMMLMIASVSGQAEEISNQSLGSNTNSVSQVGHKGSCTNSSCSTDGCKGNCLTEKEFRKEVRRNGGVIGAYDGKNINGYCEKCKGARGYRDGSGRCPNCRGGRCRGQVGFSPGHGWRVPGYNPVERQNFEYTKYWPNYWSGYGPGAPVYAHPVVYTPTDTTQLGYYYNHVPQWRPIAGMLPPAPVPSQYHDRSIRYNHRNHFWGNYDEDHKWRHRVQYSKAASGHREPIYNSDFHSNNGGVIHDDGAIHSTCPTCQPEASGNYPTPVEETDKGTKATTPVPEPIK